MPTTDEQRAIMQSLTVEKEAAVVVDIAMTVSTEKKGGTAGKFILYSTTAPVSLDWGGATLPVMESDGIRWVLVNVSDLESQLARWQSGLYAWHRSADPTTEGVLAVLWRRVLGK